MSALRPDRGKVHVVFAASIRSMAVVLVLSAGSIQQVSAQMSMPSPGAKDSMMENPLLAHARLDQFEGRTNGSDSEFRWDDEGWIGTDMKKLWVKSEGFRRNGRFGFVNPRANLPVDWLESKIAMPAIAAAVDRRAPQTHNPSLLMPT